jgi:hypothetical protein
MEAIMAFTRRRAKERIHLRDKLALIWKQSWHLRGAEPKNAFIFGTS